MRQLGAPALWHGAGSVVRSAGSALPIPLVHLVHRLIRQRRPMAGRSSSRCWETRHDGVTHCASTSIPKMNQGVSARVVIGIVARSLPMRLVLTVGKTGRKRRKVQHETHWRKIRQAYASRRCGLNRRSRLEPPVVAPEAHPSAQITAPASRLVGAAAARGYGSYWQCHPDPPTSRHSFDLARPPLSGKERLFPAVEAQKREPALAGRSLNPVAILCVGWFGWAEVHCCGPVLAPRPIESSREPWLPYNQPTGHGRDSEHTSCRNVGADASLDSEE